jgi:hypothetical protein
MKRSGRRVVWGLEHVEVTATEAMEAEANSKSDLRTGPRDAAKKFLLEILAHGRVSKRDIEEAASRSTNRRPKGWSQRRPDVAAARTEGGSVFSRLRLVSSLLANGRNHHQDQAKRG